MNYLLFGIKYILNYRIHGDRQPLICGQVLHNTCNLRCRHCTVVDRPPAKMRFEETTEVIDNFYAEGGRCLYLEGGEPFLWKDGPYTMEDVVHYARDKGFYAVVIYTNGTQALDSKADTLFVSVDGLRETHDALRGKSFDRIMDNIRNSDHRSIFINYTINTVNQADIEDFCSYTGQIPGIKGTFFYFHTPYYGHDDLHVDTESKREILLRLIRLKKKHRILNSTAGLRSAIRNDWKKNLKICRVYEGGKVYTCCREKNDGALCDECGYLSYAEIDQTLKLKPGAVWNALKYF